MQLAEQSRLVLLESTQKTTYLGHYKLVGGQFSDGDPHSKIAQFNLRAFCKDWQNHFFLHEFWVEAAGPYHLLAVHNQNANMPTHEPIEIQFGVDLS